ncbi:DUF58 domain-containing protein [Kineobactrum salinum]|uniref:DUF58 domain-containing protein n=1 Tax=Kineobactrum salinum TaxID=2708301 RepID=A0A6C0U5V2_9GAMM|nr:DUF58 domain-containing protein [Kineobactrum salinum]QIB67233.1 DUF58 domain-containing protein [Kineobactrum salinum]
MKDITLPARGAYVDLTELIGLRFAAAQLQLTRRNRALSALTGPNKASFRGRGIDFEEVRSYQPGDDIRTIDWRVTARTGTAHTKLFREERERPVLIVVDQRSNLFFGSRHCCKSVLAAQLASLLAWSALGNGDRVGGLVFNEQLHHEIRPRRNRRTVLALLSQIDSCNRQLPLPAGDGDSDDDDRLAAVLGNLRRIVRPGSNVYLISDFLGADTPAAREQLFRLAQHTEITALSCTDPMEAELPPPGRYAVTDGYRRSELNTANPKLRERYRLDRSRHRETLARELQRLGIPLLQASTEEPPFLLLQRYFGERRR